MRERGGGETWGGRCVVGKKNEGGDRDVGSERNKTDEGEKEEDVWRGRERRERGQRTDFAFSAGALCVVGVVTHEGVCEGAHYFVRH